MNLHDPWMLAVARIRLGDTLLRIGENEQALAELYDAWEVVRHSHEPAVPRHALACLIQAFEHGPTGFHSRLAGGNERQCRRIKLVLRFQDARGEGFLGVAGEHRNCRLGDDWAAVGRFGNEMHRATVDSQTCVERAPMRVETYEGRQ